MVDKAISALTEVTSISSQDWLVIDTAGGNTRKVRRKNVDVEGKLMPRMVQKATMINDGTIALPAAPTVGNLMVFIATGWYGSLATYVPAGFTLSSSYSADTNNGTWCYFRRVQSGDTGSYAVSATDFACCALYEFENAAGVYGVTGGALSAVFSGNNFQIPIFGSLYGAQDYLIGACETDGYGWWLPDTQSGITIDLNWPKNEANHKGMIFSLREKTAPTAVTGSLSSSPLNAAYGLFAVSGSFL